MKMITTINRVEAIRAFTRGEPPIPVFGSTVP
jgi:hypothetical protein